MNVNDLKQSRFLTKNDCGTGILVTIKEVVQENVSADGEAEEMHWCMYFDETEKPLILKPVNGALLQSILGSGESDDWIGRKVVLFEDKTVMMKGKITGGIRIRAPRNQQPARPAAARPSPVAGTPTPRPRSAPAPEPEPPLNEPEGDDQVPF
jgi:hypothetical protein